MNHHDSDEEMQMEQMQLEQIVIHVEGQISDSSNDSTNDSDSDSTSTIFYSDSDYSYNSEDNESELDEECEHICMDETEFMDSEKIEGKYYIGFSLLMNAKYILDTAITPKSFFKYRYDCVIYYLDGYSIFPANRTRINRIQTKIQIMQLFINPKTGAYNVVLKTFWLKIIQRTWKRVYRERQEMLRQRCSMANVRNFDLRGTHLVKFMLLPGLYGMIRKSLFIF